MKRVRAHDCTFCPHPTMGRRKKKRKQYLRNDEIKVSTSDSRLHVEEVKKDGEKEVHDGGVVKTKEVDGGGGVRTVREKEWEMYVDYLKEAELDEIWNLVHSWEIEKIIEKPRMKYMRSIMEERETSSAENESGKDVVEVKEEVKPCDGGKEAECVVKSEDEDKTENKTVNTVIGWLEEEIEKRKTRSSAETQSGQDVVKTEEEGRWPSNVSKLKENDDMNGNDDWLANVLDELDCVMEMVKENDINSEFVKPLEIVCEAKAKHEIDDMYDTAKGGEDEQASSLSIVCESIVEHEIDDKMKLLVLFLNALPPV